MTAKEYLNEIRKADLELAALAAKVAQLREQAQGVRAMQLSDMPKGGQSRGADDCVAELVDLQNAMSKRGVEIYKRQSEALQMIMQMPVMEQRAVLLHRYFCKMSWEDIAESMHYSLRGIHKLHGAALQSFGLVFDEDDKECTKVHMNL